MTIHALRGGHVLTGDGWARTDLLIDGDRIVAAGRPQTVLDVTDCFVAPGLVDIHVHAAGGHAAQGPHADLAAMAVALAATGVTSFLATSMTAPLDELRALVTSPPPAVGARCLGVHLEGPWLAPDAAGAQSSRDLRPVHMKEALDLIEAGPVRIVTLAPELPLALDLVRELVARGIRVSLGHSRTTHSLAVQAVAAGATGVSHCYNAMSQLSAREPGLVGAALAEPGLVVEVIGDGVHVHQAAFRALHAARGAREVALVSDGVDGSGGPGRLLRDGDVLRREDGTLAGSALGLLDAVRRCRTWGISLADALVMASDTPARALGLDVSLSPGNLADVIVLDSDLQLRHVLIGGASIAVDRQRRDSTRPESGTTRAVGCGACF